MSKCPLHHMVSDWGPCMSFRAYYGHWRLFLFGYSNPLNLEAHCLILGVNLKVRTFKGPFMVTIYQFFLFQSFEQCKNFLFSGFAIEILQWKLIVPLTPKMDRGSTGSGLTTVKRGKNQQAGKFRRVEPTTLVMGTCNSKPELSCCV